MFLSAMHSRDSLYYMSQASERFDNKRAPVAAFIAILKLYNYLHVLAENTYLPEVLHKESIDCSFFLFIPPPFIIPQNFHILHKRCIMEN